ncbi:fumarylacetoacetate hydrolase family protein [Shewanella metallivivens]|uniref:Fumarylacetoacetate hydrolase family protein n=1 Tax=Shewanella metallivivens TaxID=2872342 RepID=A0ABT5TI34_9GAMM|nr:fumarylacetoacetate hydrolase family protein [Shewanella metallivivens]
MTDNTHLTELANHLFAQRNHANPNAHFDAFTAQNIDQAITVQQKMAELNGHISGWKCLVPQANDQLIVAPILQAAKRGQQCSIIPTFKSEQALALIEPEIAFILGEDIEPYRHYSHQEIDSAISATHMALELIQHRFSRDSQPSYLQKLADGLSNQGVYIGPQIPKSVAYQASQVDIVVTANNDTQAFNGKHPCELPQLPVYWMINYLAQKGIKLSAGQAIITGSYCGVVNVPMATEISIEYKDIGQFTVSFVDALA